MLKRALPALLLAVVLFSCNFSPPTMRVLNTVGGARIVSFAQTPLTQATTSVSLNQGVNWQAGQLAIAAIISYNGTNPSITAPRGWRLIRDDTSLTTRQSLYWHIIQACDPTTQAWTFSEPVDTQGVVLVLDKFDSAKPIDASSGNTGGGQVLTGTPMTTRSDGDLILFFYATDFVGTAPGHDIPHDLGMIVDLDREPHEYWVLAAYQSGSGKTGAATCNAAQVFRWVAAQVAVRRAT